MRGSHGTKSRCEEQRGSARLLLEAEGGVMFGLYDIVVVDRCGERR
jgi:hypothetical protein